jgi:hypothetical protein
VVDICCNESDDDTCSSNAKNSDRIVVVTVSFTDEGPGIADEHLGDIYESFVQVIPLLD